jgi:hypothetical protein
MGMKSSKEGVAPVEATGGGAEEEGRALTDCGLEEEAVGLVLNEDFGTLT